MSNHHNSHAYNNLKSTKNLNRYTYNTVHKLKGHFELITPRLYFNCTLTQKSISLRFLFI